MPRFKRPVRWPAASVIVAVAILATSFFQICNAQQYRTPYLRQQGTATQLVVDDKPFLVLAGELGNSTSSSLEYMRPVWPRLAALNLNTVLMPVYWDRTVRRKIRFSFA